MTAQGVCCLSRATSWFEACFCGEDELFDVEALSSNWMTEMRSLKLTEYKIVHTPLYSFFPPSPRPPPFPPALARAASGTVNSTGGRIHKRVNVNTILFYNDIIPWTPFHVVCTYICMYFSWRLYGGCILFFSVEEPVFVSPPLHSKIP